MDRIVSWRFGHLKHTTYIVTTTEHENREHQVHVNDMHPFSDHRRGSKSEDEANCFFLSEVDSRTFLVNNQCGHRFVCVQILIDIRRCFPIAGHWNRWISVVVVLHSSSSLHHRSTTVNKRYESYRRRSDISFPFYLSLCLSFVSSIFFFSLGLVRSIVSVVRRGSGKTDGVSSHKQW